MPKRSDLGQPYERGMYYGDAATNPSPQGELRSVIIPKQTQAQLTRDFDAEVFRDSRLVDGRVENVTTFP